jgi:hypothetical protein
MVASIGAWTAGAGISVAVGVLALSRIDDGLAEHTVQPLTRDAVVRQSPEPSVAGGPAASPTDPPATPRSTLSSRPRGATSTPSSTPSGAPTDQVVSSPGGTAIVRCLGSGAYLVSWSPAQGYYADDVHRGPAAEVVVRFESETRSDVVSARCPAGVPQPAVSAGQKHPDE